MDLALTAARLRPRLGLDDAIGIGLTVVALVLTALIGVKDSERPIYGPIDEITHTAYVLAVAKDGIPPFLGRDRAFAGPGPMAARDVRIPAPDKVGSAPVPIGAFNDVLQSEAIQPPVYYYAAAPVTWFVDGRDKVIAIRLFDVFLCLCAILIAFLAVRDLSASPLGGGIAALTLASAGGIVDIQSFVTNGAIMLPLGGAILWLAARGVRARRLSWPLVCVAGAFSISHTIVVPLAAICLFAAAIAQLRAEGRAAWRGPATRVVIAGIPLALWVLSNLYRYHWVTPRAAASGPGYAPSTKALDLQQFATNYRQSFVDSIQEPFHWWQTSPYIWDYRPLLLLIPLTLGGLAYVLMRGSERERTAVGFWLLAVVVAHLSVFLMLYLAVVVTGGGDFVYRYFTAEQAAAACLAGTIFAALFRNPVLARSAALVLGAALTYFTYTASPL